MWNGPNAASILATLVLLSLRLTRELVAFKHSSLWDNDDVCLSWCGLRATCLQSRAKLRILAGLSSFPSPAPKEITQVTRKLGQSEPFHALLDTARLHIMAEITGLPRLAPPPPQTESHSQSLT